MTIDITRNAAEMFYGMTVSNRDESGGHVTESRVTCVCRKRATVHCRG